MDSKTVSRKRLDWLMLACVNLAFPATMIWQRYKGEIGATTAVLTVSLVAICLLNIAVVVGVRSRNRRQGQTPSRVFVAGAVAFAIISAGVMAIGVFSVPAHNQYVDLALSNIPINQIHPEQKALVVELIRRKAINSRDYDSINAQTKPLSPPLYSPGSFASADAIRNTVEEMKKTTDIDFDYYAKQQQADADFRKKMSVADPEYLKAWGGPSADDLAQDAIWRLEQQWLSSTLALYDYAASHQREISVRNGKLEFATTGVQIAFDQRLEYSKTLHAKLQERFQGLSRDKQQQRSRIIMPSNPQTSLP